RRGFGRVVAVVHDLEGDLAPVHPARLVGELEVRVHRGTDLGVARGGRAGERLSGAEQDFVCGDPGVGRAAVVGGGRGGGSRRGGVGRARGRRRGGCGGGGCGGGAGRRRRRGGAVRGRTAARHQGGCGHDGDADLDDAATVQGAGHA